MHLESNSIPTRAAKRVQTNIEYTRTQGPYRDRAMLSISCGGMGQQWTATETGTLGEADLGMA